MTKIDRDTELKLLGLRALAEGHNRKLEDIRLAVCEILGLPKDDYGWASDYVFDTDLAITPQELWDHTANDREPESHD